MIFEPCGWCKKPSTMNELFHALHDICKALIKLHAASWMHCNIQWGNVIFKQRDNATNSWCLIDFMDAAESPQPKSNGQHLSCSNHAPEIFSQDTHTTAVDIWSLGYLITSSGYELSHIWKSGKDRTAFLNSIMHQTPAQQPSVSTTFQHLQKLEQEYLQERVQAQEGDYINVG
jgi:serine/threonine protein kinase